MSKPTLQCTDKDCKRTSRMHESHKNAHNDILSPGFPNNNMLFNSSSSVPRPRSLNPSATPFYPDNFPSQNNYE